jgi:hypothetical protein
MRRPRPQDRQVKTWEREELRRNTREIHHHDGASSDAGKTWLDVPPTLQAKTTVTGLASGTTVQFRFRSVIKGGASDWSPPFSLLVH